MNVFATYTQTAVSVVVGLFCSRWVYNALGETQYGLFSVVGSLIAFISVLNGTLMGSSGRFFAFAIGQSRREESEPDLLCKWFNTAVSVQVIMPTLFVLVGAPIGVYAIKHWLTIPDELRQSSVIIFYFSLFSMFSGMTFSPVQALYTAKQYIFVRNLLGIMTTFLFAAEGWWLLHYNGNRLVAHAAIVTAVMLGINVIYAVIAYKHFPEARIRLRYWYDKGRLKAMFSFSAYSLFGSLGVVFSHSGVAVALNKFMGPVANAAMGIGSQIYQKTSVLSVAVITAVAPEITSRYGAGKFEEAMLLTRRVCVFSTCMEILVAAPFIVYSEQILVLWLKHPPLFAAEISVIMVLSLLGDKITAGYRVLIEASGHIKLYSTITGISTALCCGGVALLLWLDFPLVFSLWAAWFAPLFIICQARVWFAKRVVGVSFRKYLFLVFLPLFGITLVSLGFVSCAKRVAGNSLLAILGVCIANGILIFVFMWLSIGSAGRASIKKRFFGHLTCNSGDG